MMYAAAGKGERLAAGDVQRCAQAQELSRIGGQHKSGYWQALTSYIRASIVFNV